MPFLNPYPSHSNFILCEVTSGMDAKKLKVKRLSSFVISFYRCCARRICVVVLNVIEFNIHLFFLVPFWKWRLNFNAGGPGQNGSDDSSLRQERIERVCSCDCREARTHRRFDGLHSTPIIEFKGFEINVSLVKIIWKDLRSVKHNTVFQVLVWFEAKLVVWDSSQLLILARLWLVLYKLIKYKINTLIIIIYDNFCNLFYNFD